jgi:adenine phosphoribosyltransferase
MSIVDKVKSAIRDVPDFPKPGIVFKDITPILADPVLVRQIVQALAHPYQSLKIDAVAAIEARGFIFGSILAQQLNCAFVPVRKAGRLPFKSRKQEYDLEYGKAEIEVHTDAIKSGWRVLVHDDLLATGGTASAAGKLIRSFGAAVAGFSFVVNLSFLHGEEFLTGEFGAAPEFVVKY